jgi:hypothetical protein
MSWLKLRIKGPGRSKRKSKHSPAQLFKLRQILSNGEAITEKIMNASYLMTVEDFRKKFDYPFSYLNIDLSMRLYRYLCLCKDGIVRKRDNDCIDSGISITANKWFKKQGE